MSWLVCAQALAEQDDFRPALGRDRSQAIRDVKQQEAILLARRPDPAERRR
jgi:hypothetical protein